MHPLDGPRARVKRAKEQLVALQAATQRFFNENPYIVGIAEFDKKARHHNLRVKDGPTTFPNDWSVIIGEIAHNLRSALDGLAWQLALLGKSKSFDPYERTAFPIYLMGRTKRRRPGGSLLPHFWGERDGLRLLRSIDRRHWTRIEAFQPYKRGNGDRHSPLFLLQELNNTDKHRLLTVLAPTVSGIQLTGLFGKSTLNKRVTLHPNAKVGHVLPLPEGGVPILTGIEGGRPQFGIQHEVEVDVTLTPGIRYGEGCDAVKRLPVIPTLQRMINEVSSVVESFAGEF